MEAAVVGIFIFGVLFWVVIATILGGIIGSRKGRTGAGVALGLLLGWVGVIIIAVMKPSAQAEAEKTAAQAQVLRDALGGGLLGTAGVSPTVLITAQVRQDLMAEAIRRDPSLAESSDPESLKRLGDAVAELEKEHILKTELQQLKNAQDAAELASEQAVRNAQAAEERAALAAAAARERAERIAKMSPTLRWAFQHPAPSLAILGVLALILVTSVITVGNTISTRNAENAAKEAAATAAAERKAEFAALAASCDVEELAKDGDSVDPSLLSAWAKCSDSRVQLAVAANPRTPTETLEELAKEGPFQVRARLTAVPNLPLSIQAILVADSDDSVRQAVARNTDHVELLSQLIADPSPQVREEAIWNTSTSLDLLVESLNDPDASVREALGFRMSQIVENDEREPQDALDARRLLTQLCADVQGIEDPWFCSSKYIGE